jgi:nitrite reductase/ring-hydroxylating ferredoxin subunit
MATSARLRRGGMLAVSFAGHPIVIAGTETGQVFALEDRCAHRQIPLHMGVITKEGIPCVYHGWCYDTCGRLVAIPHLSDGRKLPAETLGVQSYPCRDLVSLRGYAGKHEHHPVGLIRALDDASLRPPSDTQVGSSMRAYRVIDLHGAFRSLHAEESAIAIRE